MFGNPFKGFPGEVQAVEFRVMPLQMGHDADRLRVVIEPAMGRHRGGERVLPGVAEGRVAEVMGQRHSLRQVLVEAQRAGHGAGDLRDLQRMGQAGAEIVALMFHEDLRLVLEPPEGRGMDDPVAVALERGAEEAFLLAHAAAPAMGGIAGIWGAHAGPPGLVSYGAGATCSMPAPPPIYLP
jgi:hypothetical protein